MIHVRDVINTPFNEGNQKTFSESHSQPLRKKFVLISILAFRCKKAWITCIGFHRTLSEGQEIDIRSKLLLRVSFEKLWLEFWFWTLLSLNVESLRDHISLCCLSVDESRDTVKNIFSFIFSSYCSTIKRKMGNKKNKKHARAFGTSKKTMSKGNGQTNPNPSANFWLAENFKSVFWPFLGIKYRILGFFDILNLRMNSECIIFMIFETKKSFFDQI